MLYDRFIKYVKFDTQSQEDMEQVPSTEKQFALAGELEKELREMGASEVRLSEHCYVYAVLPSNLSPEEDAHTPALGFIAHMDTSPSASGANVSPRLVKGYDGSVIPLGHGEELSPKIFPGLKEAVGSDLIVTDGTTLLGADDKAGVAEIMEMAAYFLSHPEEKHGKICIAFTPDEEVGRGADFFDVPNFGAEVAYTVDGGRLGEIEYENFNAASARLHIKGVNVHPGSAKDTMVNACLLAMEFNALLPGCIPANTEGYEGFFHLCSMSGDESAVEMSYIIRDHDREKFEEKKRQFFQAAETVNRKYENTDACLMPVVKDSYYNMKEKVEPFRYLIDIAEQSFRECRVSPEIVPIRGGTDGARLSYEGLPCPNLSTGGANYHGIYEYVNFNAMEAMVEVLKTICRNMIAVLKV